MPLDPMSVSESIRSTYLRYLRSTFKIKDRAFSESFDKALQEFGFFKGPIIEATPPFARGMPLAQLVEEGVLDDTFLPIVSAAFPYLQKNRLYLHQELAIRKIMAGRNVVVAAGTASGKTECFLIPIIDRLMREYRAGGLGPGVRALIVYPMNALANDQLRRLREISRSCAQILPRFAMTFGRYIGETSETRADGERKFTIAHPGEEPARGELLSREEMRESPPHILITNYAMLEYLLLRPADSPFFDGNNATSWHFLILDEAHVYTGAKGIEIGLLIRRLKERVHPGVRGRFQAVATSATLATGREDFPAIARFASQLFDEPFEWESSPSRQDVIQSERELEQLEAPDLEIDLDSYAQLYDLLQSAQTEADRAASLRVFLDKHAVRWNNPHDNLSTIDTIRAVLVRERKLHKLREVISLSATELDKAAMEVLGSDSLTGNSLQWFVKFINLCVLCQSARDRDALLPARYHFFVRAPEGAFCQFKPEPLVLLGRRETHRDHAVFEVASCRRCGQLYLTGIINPTGNTRKLAQAVDNEEGVRREGRYYLLATGGSSEQSNEDEEVAVPEEIDGTGSSLRLCLRCASVWGINDAPPCQCGLDPGMVSTILEAPAREGRLNQCLSCGLRATDIVHQFVFQKDAPSAVLATSMISSTAGTASKLLVFSDSRQDAAFFAPYMSESYNRILFRRFMDTAMENNKDDDYRLESLARDVMHLAEAVGVFGPEMDDRQKKEEVWRWILQEFTGLWDRRNSLEGVGLLRFVPVFPEQWSPPDSLTSGPLRLQLGEATLLYAILLDTIRYNLVITFPAEAPGPTDAFFHPRNRQYLIRGEVSDTRRHVYSWIPSSGRSNSRSEVVRKLCKKAGLSEDEVRGTLGVIWRDLTSKWLNRGLSVAEQTAREGALFRIDHRYWRVRRAEPDELYVCNNCRTVTHVNLRGVCPVYNCMGSLKPITKQEIKELQSNHYRVLYTSMEPGRVSVREHTAQLQPDYAAEIQERFINGDVNVLSCSTTFELGVDLGALDTVFLKNVPPEPSNYVQRAGRAGRRSGAIGYTLTFAQLRSHDLSHFRDPYHMVVGSIMPPVITMQNGKIARRHVHSVALSFYLRQRPQYYGTLADFLGFDDGFCQSDLLRQFFSTRSPSLEHSLLTAIPEELHDELGLVDWKWVEAFVGPDGDLRIAEERIRDEFENLRTYYERQTQSYVRAADQRSRNKIHHDMQWADRRLNAIRKTSLLDFLSSNTVIPKYGFPVDVVELKINSSLPCAGQVKLERDLRMAIAEFAPGSKVVANGYIWTSTGLQSVAGRAWPRYRYAICDSCGRFTLSKRVEFDPDESCSNCRTPLTKNKWFSFLVPQFGFVSGRAVVPEKAGLMRPKTYYGTRPFFHDYSQPEETTFRTDVLSGYVRFSSKGELAVISRGTFGKGFYVCESCGYACETRTRARSHSSPFNSPCEGTPTGPYHLGHSLITDVAEINLTQQGQALAPISDRVFWYSLLYAFLEGMSQAMQISRRDIDGCLFPRADGYSLIVFDEVPGGAGHARRVVDPSALKGILTSAWDKLEHCTCGIETSCYSCLRNYRNQFCHGLLRRGAALPFLRAVTGT